MNLTQIPAWKTCILLVQQTLKVTGVIVDPEGNMHTAVHPSPAEPSDLDEVIPCTLVKVEAGHETKDRLS